MVGGSAHSTTTRGHQMATVTSLEILLLTTGTVVIVVQKHVAPPPCILAAPTGITASIRFFTAPHSPQMIKITITWPTGTVIGVAILRSTIVTVVIAVNRPVRMRRTLVAAMVTSALTRHMQTQRQQLPRRRPERPRDK